MKVRGTFLTKEEFRFIAQNTLKENELTPLAKEGLKSAAVYRHDGSFRNFKSNLKKKVEQSLIEKFVQYVFEMQLIGRYYKNANTEEFELLQYQFNMNYRWFSALAGDWLYPDTKSRFIIDLTEQEKKLNEIDKIEFIKPSLQIVPSIEYLDNIGFTDPLIEEKRMKALNAVKDLFSATEGKVFYKRFPFEYLFGDPGTFSQRLFPYGEVEEWMKKSITWILSSENYVKVTDDIAESVNIPITLLENIGIWHDLEECFNQMQDHIDGSALANMETFSRYFVKDENGHGWFKQNEFDPPGLEIRIRKVLREMENRKLIERKEDKFMISKRGRDLHLAVHHLNFRLKNKVLKKKAVNKSAGIHKTP